MNPCIPIVLDSCFYFDAKLSNLPNTSKEKYKNVIF